MSFRLPIQPRFKALWWRIKHPHGVSAKPVHRIASRSARMEERLAIYWARAKAFLAVHPLCEFPDCRCKSRDVHHVRGRVGSLLLDERFWKAMCRQHHDWINRNPDAARELGLLAQPGEWNTTPRG